MPVFRRKRLHINGIIISFLLILIAIGIFKNTFQLNMLVSNTMETNDNMENTIPDEVVQRNNNFINNLKNTSRCSNINMDLPYYPFSAIRYWQDNLINVIGKSKHILWSADFNEYLLLLSEHWTVDRLYNSASTLPRNNDLHIIMDKVMTIYNDRNNKDNDNHLPIQILVLGGSVTRGMLSNENPTERNARHALWPSTLERLVNGVAGFKVIKITNIAQGGTNSEQGTFIIDYSLFPEDMLQPDIIIHAYSSNDMHILSMDKANAENKTLYDAVFDNLQEFIRSVLTMSTSRPCSNIKNPPMLIILDDYLGNEQLFIHELMTFNTAMKQLSNYYGIMSISYADAVRDLVYADTYEKWFSPTWYDNDKNMQREIHLKMVSLLIVHQR